MSEFINNCFVKTIVHDQSGQEFDQGFIEDVSFVETLDFDGPKFILTMADQYDYLKDELKVKELDTVTCSLSDDFARSGLNSSVNFTIVTNRSTGHFTQYNMMSTPIFSTKNPWKGGSKAFVQKKVDDIVGYFVKGLKLDIKPFPVVEDYHCLAGERPSILLRQLAIEKGAHIWADRDTCSFKAFKSLWNQGPAHTYHHAKDDEANTIVNYRVPSQKKQLTDTIPKGYSGWDFSTGKIGGGGAPAFSASQKSLTLTQKQKGAIEVIDFVCHGNGGIRPGQVLKLVWHLPDPERPLDENLPEKVVVSVVAHHYSSQKYYCRVKGVTDLAAA